MNMVFDELWRLDEKYIFKRRFNIVEGNMFGIN